MSGAAKKLVAPHEAGFATVAAVFLITVLALLSAYLVGFRVYQDAALSLDTLGTRAFGASRAGTQWAAYNSLQNNVCTASTSLALAGTLAGFTATVTCTRNTYNEAGTNVSVDTIVANACNQPAAGACPNPAPGINYAERQMTVTVAR